MDTDTNHNLYLYINKLLCDIIQDYMLLIIVTTWEKKTAARTIQVYRNLQV